MENKEDFLEYKLAKNLREIIEKNKNNGLTKNDIGFLYFPAACCDKTSEILKKYLVDNGIGDYSFVKKSGTYNGYSYDHVWLENNMYLIDITGDQFNGKINGVIFDKVIFIEKDNYFFNTINNSIDNYSEGFMIPSDGFFNYLDFYNKYVKNSKI